MFCEACVPGKPGNRVDHERHFLGQLVSLCVDGGESFGEGGFACMRGGGAVAVWSLED